MGKKALKRKRHSIRRWFILALLSLLLLFFGRMYICARTVTIRYAQVVVPDLPSSFHGTKILHITDLDMMSTNTLSAQKRLLSELTALSPDIVLLGGDYTAASWIQKLNGASIGAVDDRRERLFEYTAALNPTLGIYAVSGDLDGDPILLEQQMKDKGISLIDGQLLRIDQNGASLYIAGLDKSMNCLSQVEKQVSKSDCVIALMHSPERFSEAFVREAIDGGQWMDLALAGHTHGGQIVIGNTSILTLNEFEKRYLAGWFTDSVPFLVNQGAGCEGINLRLNSQSEVWLLELRCK